MALVSQQISTGTRCPYFRVSAGTVGRAEEVQRDTVSAVLDQVRPEQASFVHRVPVTVGPEDRDFAQLLRRRLRARFLLYGRIADAPDGNWSVYPRIVEPARGGSVTHFDPHTRDVTCRPHHLGERPSGLPPTLHVTDEEYPHAFCNDRRPGAFATTTSTRPRRPAGSGSKRSPQYATPPTVETLRRAHATAASSRSVACSSTPSDALATAVPTAPHPQQTSTRTRDPRSRRRERRRRRRPAPACAVAARRRRGRRPPAGHGTTPSRARARAARRTCGGEHVLELGVGRGLLEEERGLVLGEDAAGSPQALHDARHSGSSPPDDGGRPRAVPRSRP